MGGHETDLLTPVHPGEILREEFLVPMGLKVGMVAQACGISQDSLHAILSEQASMTSDIAVRLAAFFSVSASLWMNLQSHFDIKLAEERAGPQIEYIKHHRSRASLGKDEKLS